MGKFILMSILFLLTMRSIVDGDRKKDQIINKAAKFVKEVDKAEMIHKMKEGGKSFWALMFGDKETTTTSTTTPTTTTTAPPPATRTMSTWTIIIYCASSAISSVFILAIVCEIRKSLKPKQKQRNTRHGNASSNWSQSESTV